jgi:hypothetical protein
MTTENDLVGCTPGSISSGMVNVWLAWPALKVTVPVVAT